MAARRSTTRLEREAEEMECDMVVPSPAPRKWRETRYVVANHLSLVFYSLLFALSVVVIVNVLTSPPTLSPLTEQQQQQLAVACHFLKLTDLTTCQTTTVFPGHPVDNTIPTEIGLLTQLTFLYLVHNSNISGPIPSTLGNLANLTSLVLDHNHLTGTIPSALGNLTQLQYLSLHSNQLNGTIPTTLGLLTKLTLLSLYSNQLTGTIPSTLGNLTQLQYLYLHYNHVGGTFPSTLGNLKQWSQGWKD